VSRGFDLPFAEPSRQVVGMARKLDAVLVGCGGMSGAWLKVLTEMPDVRLVGLVDVMEDAARRRAEEFRLTEAQTGTDLEAMLRVKRPDVVLDCTIPSAHVGVTLAALRRGCHVLGEKPMAENLDDARRMIRAAKRADRIYAIIQNRRYLNNINVFRKTLSLKALGGIHTLFADFRIGAHFGGFRDRMAHVLLVDMAIHTFDQARYLTGWEPVAVHCHEWNPKGSWYDRDASAIALFEMSDGAVFSYRGSWCAEGLNSSWESAWHAQGTRGAARWDGGDSVEAEVVAKTGGFRSQLQPLTPPVLPPLPYTGHAGNIRDFLRGVRTGRPPMTVCTDNIRSLAMALGAVESAESGKSIRIRC
jgi:predicted dehydrogenase